MFSKARYYARIGDKDSAFASFDAILTKKKTTTSKKIDAAMDKARVAIFHSVRRLKAPIRNKLILITQLTGS